MFPNCPSIEFKEIVRDAFRWINNPLILNDFTPVNLINEPPPRMLDDSDKMCVAFGLSMFDTLLNSKLKYQKEYNKRRPHLRDQFKQDKGGYIALVNLTQDDGVADQPNENNYGHFTFHEYSETSLVDKVSVFYYWHPTKFKFHKKSENALI